jgi:hypothetical protein
MQSCMMFPDRLYAFGISAGSTYGANDALLPVYTAANPPLTWTECTTGAPNCPASTPGPIDSVFRATSILNGTSDIQAIFSPTVGCTEPGGTSHVRCLYFTGRTTTGPSNFAIFMATNEDTSKLGVMSTYTAYNGGTPTALIGPAALAGATTTASPGVESIADYNGVHYMPTGWNNFNGGNFNDFWTSPTTGNGAGVTWTLGGTFQGSTATDWDYSAIGIYDNWLIKNSCGFYEFFYTAGIAGGKQYEGYSVASSPLGPMFKLPHPVISITAGQLTNALFNGQLQLGDPAVISINGTLFYFINNDNPALTVNQNSLGMMPDTCPMIQPGNTLTGQGPLPN